MLRDRMREDVNYKNAVIEWLKTNIKCELPGQRELLREDKLVHLTRPRVSADKIDP
jgi:hypothetical protein